MQFSMIRQVLLGILLILEGRALGFDIRSNQFVDTALRNNYPVELNLRSLDPVPLKNITTHDPLTIFGLNSRVTTHYYNGNMTGVSDVMRWGDCSSIYYRNESRALNCTIVFPQVKLNFNGRMRYGGAPQIPVRANVNFANRLVFTEVVAAPGILPSLAQFTLESVEPGQVTLSGLGPLNLSLNRYKKSLLTGATAQMKHVFNGQVKDVINSSVSRTQFPSV